MESRRRNVSTQHARQVNQAGSEPAVEFRQSGAGSRVKVNSGPAVNPQPHPHLADRVEWPKVESLRPSPRNARIHSKSQIKAIARSIGKFGFTNPILVHGRNEIVAGHGRLAAAVLLGLKRVPVLRLEGLSKADVQAYALADNRLAELAEWDNDLITEIVEEILEIDETYDLELTGFAVAELDRIVSEQERAGGRVESDPAADALPDTCEGPPISALG